MAVRKMFDIHKVTGLQSNVVVGIDKIFTVPDVEVWTVNSIYISHTATATVGNRQIEISVRDGSDVVIFVIAADILQTASQVRAYTFGQGLPRESAFVDNLLLTPLPPIVIPTGFDLRIRDLAAVDVLDTLAVHVMHEVNRM